VTAPSQSPAQRQKPQHLRRTVNLRASQAGLSVVRGIITPFTSNAVIPPIEHNGTAMLNVRAHAVRATARLLALVWLDVVASQTLRALATAVHKLPAVARVVTERLDLLVGVGELGGLRLAAALLIGLVLTGAYGSGDRRRSAQHILAGCAVATLLSLWGELWTAPAQASLQIVFNAALLGAAVLGGRLLLDAVVCKVVPAPLPRTVLVGTTEGRQSISDGDDEGECHREHQRREEHDQHGGEHEIERTLHEQLLPAQGDGAHLDERPAAAPEHLGADPGERETARRGQHAALGHHRGAHDGGEGLVVELAAQEEGVGARAD